MDRVYFNDEWNEAKSLIDNSDIRKYQIIYDITMIKLNNLLEKELKDDRHAGKTYLPKGLETLEKFEEYKNNLKINAK